MMRQMYIEIVRIKGLCQGDGARHVGESHRLGFLIPGDVSTPV